MTLFEHALESILNEEFADNYTAAVAVVQSGSKWLLGLSRSKDDRNNKFCFPGGHIKGKESPERAAERECWEETGIRCKAVGKPFILANKKGVAFVHCKARGGQTFENNHEFSALGWFDSHEMRALKLYDNVRKLVERVKR